MTDRQSTPFDYLRDRIGAVARGKPVRDLDEAFEAVRVENERLRRDLAEAIALATVWLGNLKPEWNELVARVQGNSRD